MKARLLLVDDLVTVNAGRGRRMRVQRGSSIRIACGRFRWSVAIYARGTIIAKCPPLGWGFAYRRESVAKPDRFRPRASVLVLTLTVPTSSTFTITAHAPHRRQS